MTAVRCSDCTPVKSRRTSFLRWIPVLFLLCAGFNIQLRFPVQKEVENLDIVSRTTFVFSRDVSNNLYHTLIWHLSTLQRAANKFGVDITHSDLRLFDEKGPGPFFLLYGLLGFKTVEMATYSNIHALCHLPEELIISLSEAKKLGNCIIIPRNFGDVARIQARPRGETHLRSAAPELYGIRAKVRSILCHGIDDSSILNSIVYVSRNGGSRGVSNEGQLLELLENIGGSVTVVRLEEENLEQQANVFCNAQFVIGPHGAGFTWLIAAPSNAVFVEIFPYGWADPCYRNIGVLSGVTYFSYQNTVLEWHDISKYKGRHGYTHVNLTDLQPIIEAAKIASTNGGNSFAPPCKDISLLPKQLLPDFPCQFVFHRSTDEELDITPRFMNS